MNKHSSLSEKRQELLTLGANLTDLPKRQEIFNKKLIAGSYLVGYILGIPLAVIAFPHQDLGGNVLIVALAFATSKMVMDVLGLKVVDLDTDAMFLDYLIERQKGEGLSIRSKIISIINQLPILGSELKKLLKNKPNS